MIREIIIKNRSYRRFYEDQKIETGILKELVDIARLTPSSRNLQPLKYIISADELKNGIIFRNLAWAGYLKDWGGPPQGERPVAYIIILGDTSLASGFSVDHGIAAQSILLAATEKGFGGCIIASINRTALARELKIPSRFEVLLVLALGKPKETVVIEDFRGDVKYWRDENQVHHVPKRLLEEVILDI
jgi:nitroreductase